MLFLTLYVIAFVAFQHLFRYAQLRGEKSFPIFTANYLVAGLCAIVWASVTLGKGLFQLGPAVVIAGLVTGLFFISQLWTILDSFRFAGVGITVAVAAASLVIPAFYGWLAFHETLNLAGWIGMALVLPAVFLLRPRDAAGPVRVGLRENASLIGCFLLGGGIGIAHKTCNAYLKSPDHFIGYITIIYCTAAVVGVAALLFTRQRMSLRTLYLGVPIGLSNIFSLACLMLALDHMEIIVAYPIQGSMTIVLGMLAGMVLWKERPLPRQWIGLALAVALVILISSQPADPPVSTDPDAPMPPPTAPDPSTAAPEFTHHGAAAAR